ncbi:hypothetical protein T552_00692 [Pneumocystis carinii B80]|uniref:SH3 domain-containing protein n=1 Tax=Pneumocystis carinii (strain B80) TaxID=1408658 RepID=A0A0W4ZPD5_PNEC8|nr:hypothetical protein T552_00692 [Pneumocystis carinii B80]KTW30214.1 hypothetical protein T552_00692 [Pneumocystis carinii B80]
MYMKESEQTQSYLDISYLIDDMFLLVTVIFALIGWLITAISLIISNIRSLYLPYYSWWVAVYQIFVIFCVVAVILSNSGNTYRIALVGLIVVALCSQALLCDSIIYYSKPSQRAVASGCIFLSIVDVLWILYYGTGNDSFCHLWTNSYILESSENIKLVPKVSSDKIVASGDSLIGSYRNNNHVETTYTANEHCSLNFLDSTANNTAAQHEYPHKVKAIYSYNANPDDPREISFVKDEILEISDITGKWWQARKHDGTIGIIPSNYVQLIVK